jgi:hypothetical protein
MCISTLKSAEFRAIAPAELVTKKVMVACCACTEAVTPSAAIATAPSNESESFFFIRVLPVSRAGGGKPSSREHMLGLPPATEKGEWDRRK